MNYCNQILKTFDKTELKFLETKFRDANDEERFRTVYNILNKSTFNIVKTASNKNESLAESCLKESKDLLKANKAHCALKKLNEASAHAKQEKLVKQIEAQRLLVLKRSDFASEIKKPRLQQNSAPGTLIENECSDGASLSPPLLLGRNDEIGAFSQSVHLHFSEDFGRHVIAAESLEPGCVIGIEQPLASVLCPSCKYTHCSQCFAKCHILIPCQQCTQALYCSESCRGQAWTAHHSSECQLAIDLETAGLSPVDSLTVRILNIFRPDKIMETMAAYRSAVNRDPRRAGFDAKGKFVSESLFSFLSTFSNPNCWSFEEMLKMCVKAYVIIKLCDLEEITNLNTLGAFLLRCLHGIPLIAHEISERCTCKSETLSDHNIGFGIFSAISMMNHSCDQNVVKHNYGKVAVVRTIRRVSKGDQILDSYGPHFIADPLPQRMETLRTKFRFTCDCSACALDLPTQLNLPWSLDFEMEDDVKEALRHYLETGRVERVTEGKLKRAIAQIDLQNKRICQEYFVLQQMLKLIYAEQSNF